VGERFLTDLQTVKVSRLRATGVISTASTETVIRLGDVEQTVGLALRKFANGGSWSLFVAPCCGRRAQILRLYDGRLHCGRCLIDRGVYSRFAPMSVRQRAAVRAPELRARLSSDKSERLKPHLWGTLERRSHFEAALRQAEFRAAQLRSPRKKVEAIIDPCNEPDFKPPRRPWPGRKSKLSEPG
jgi:hypothetical protein